jgi:uncharacterized Zn finger protein
MTVSLVPCADRRHPNRLPQPSCPYCSTEEYVSAVIRTKQFVFFRCQQCRALLPKLIPAMKLPHGFVARVTSR